MLDHPLHEEILPDIQSKPPLVHLQTVSLYAIICHLRKETDTFLAETSFQVVAGSLIKSQIRTQTSAGLELQTMAGSGRLQCAGTDQPQMTRGKDVRLGNEDMFGKDLAAP